MLQNCESDKKKKKNSNDIEQGKSEKLSHCGLRRQNDRRQCGVLHWALEQKEDVNGKTVEILIKPGVWS